MKNFLARAINHCIWRYNKVTDWFLFYPRVLWCRIWYSINVRRIARKLARGERIRVLFVVTCTAKWKTQTVYDAMVKSGVYDPVICVSRPDWDVGDSDLARAKAVTECVEFFRKRGMKCERVYEPKDDRPLSLLGFDPDIVFYQQSWFSVRGQLPYNIAHRAVTCYVPYYVPNYGDVDLDTRLPLHPLLWRYFALNNEWVRVYREANMGRMYAGEFVGVGHPTLDEYVRQDRCGFDRQCVIYAPHWTFDCEQLKDSLRYGTFEWNGRKILEYAQEHPEIEWVFKPHPGLRISLPNGGFMTKDEVDEYYAAWDKIGLCYDSGGYADLFNRSSVMVTDCGSFLTEYAVTGKPIIHLISRDRRFEALAPSKKLYSSYYQVHSLDEMLEAFKLIIENGEDPLKAKRLQAIEDAHLTNGSAACNILSCLSSSFKL